MQVARTFFLSTDRTGGEALGSHDFHRARATLQQQQIFELYANEVYLGNRGSFGIRGFSQPAWLISEKI